MKKLYVYFLAVISLLLFGCGGSSDSSSGSTPVIPQSNNAKVVIIPLAYADADPATIDDSGEGISLSSKDDLNRLFLAKSSHVNQWFEWASRGKHSFSETSLSLNWKYTSLSVPEDLCAKGSGSFYPLQKIIPQIKFSAEEIAEIDSADQIIVLGYGQGNCRGNDSFMNTESTRIGTGNYGHVTYIDLERVPFGRTIPYSIGDEYSGLLANEQDVRLFNVQQTFIHEYLHTFKIGHGDAGKTCSWEMINDGLCSLDTIFNESIIDFGDYSDAYDIMGNRHFAYGLNAIYRMKLGWLDSVGELIVDGEPKVLSSVNVDDITGSKLIKIKHKNKVLYFSNYYERDGSQGFDNILRADFAMSIKTGLYDHNEKVMERNTDGVMLHYEVYNSYYNIWSTKLISQSGQLDEWGVIRYEKAAFTEGRYKLDDGLVITVTKFVDGQFELSATSL